MSKRNKAAEIQQEKIIKNEKHVVRGLRAGKNHSNDDIFKG